MKRNLLKFKLAILFSIFLFMGVQAQQNRFIYIQTENKKPFYVKMDEKNLNSSATGYILIPGLADSIYKLIIGFANNSWPEQTVYLNTQFADAGFLLKNDSDNSWCILNLKTNQVIKPDNQAATVGQVVVKKTNNEFARILAEVVNDPSIAMETVKRPPVEVASIPIDTIKVDKAVVTADAMPVKLPASDDSMVHAKSIISKLKTDSTKEGLKVTYLDFEKNNTDTVTIVIAFNDQEVKPIPEKKINVLPELVKSADKPNTDSRFIDMQLQNPNAKKDSVSSNKTDFVITEKKAKTNEINVPLKTEMINSDCKRIAEEKEFLKLRKQMAAAKNEGEMTKTAIKTFTSTCFTTEQIKNLGVLYIKEEERYKFFVAAYPFVSDTHNFTSLEDQLTDNYYLTRFKAMVSH